MSPLLYEVLHIFGILLAFISLGGVTLRAMSGQRENGPGDRLAVITHGVALLVILVSGFGLIAKLGYGFPGWIWAKIVIWLLIGGLITLIRRMPQHATVFWFTIPLLGGFAAYLALYKPF
ncbi:MAG: hypothetical protein GY719_37595 [bacterium]|nr:hypothetical protein [bacterium]